MATSSAKKIRTTFSKELLKIGVFCVKESTTSGGDDIASYSRYK